MSLVIPQAKEEAETQNLEAMLVSNGQITSGNPQTLVLKMVIYTFIVRGEAWCEGVTYLLFSDAELLSAECQPEGQPNRFKV